jgi:hypothetical protein
VTATLAKHRVPRSPSCSKARADLTRTLRTAIGHADPLRVRPWSAARQAAAQERHAAGVSVDAAADLAPDTEVHVLDPGLPLAI